MKYMSTSACRVTLRFVISTGLLLTISWGGGVAASAASPSENATPAPASSPHPFAGETAWIAYQTNRNGSEGIWLIHPDGTDDHQVATDAPGEQVLPDWSPDGTRLVFATRGGETE